MKDEVLIKARVKTISVRLRASLMFLVDFYLSFELFPQDIRFNAHLHIVVVWK